MIAISLSGQNDPVKKLHLVFNIFDKNNSKTLDISEVNSILNGFKGIMDEKDSAEVNDLMNWDKDQNGSLNEEEFINLVMSKPVLKKYFIDLIKVHE
jgi:Ca2+-binding EF-hand superfamily protein